MENILIMVCMLLISTKQSEKIYVYSWDPTKDLN
jgi:hypothetical protein